MIHRTPTEAGRGARDEKVGGKVLGAHAGGVPGLPAPPRPESRGRPPLPRGASFLHRGERSLARSAGALWSLEQRVETLRSTEQGRRFRSILRRACVHELHGASPSDVRLHRRARACVGGRSKGGQEGQALGRSRGGFTTKIHAKSDASGDIIAFDLTGGEAFEGVTSKPCSISGPTFSPAPSSATKATPARPIGTPRERAASLPSSPTRPTKRTSQPSSHAPSTRPVPASSRASDGSSASSA